MGCESGDEASCADLAALFAAGRGVRLDVRRACALGLAEACERVHLPAPGTSRTPTAPLPPPVNGETPQPAPVPLEDAIDWGRYYVDPEWLAPLGFTREALLAVPAAPWEDGAMVAEVLAYRLAGVEHCLPVLVGDDDARPARGYASFVLGADGRVASPKVVVEAHERDAASVECAETSMASWLFPLARTGGRVWIPLEGRGREAPRPPRIAPPQPREAGGSSTRPIMKEPNCIAREIRIPERLIGTRGGPLVVKFAVNPNASVSDFRCMTPGAPVDLLRTVERAVLRCEFEPDGAPTGPRCRCGSSFPSASLPAEASATAGAASAHPRPPTRGGLRPRRTRQERRREAARRFASEITIRETSKGMYPQPRFDSPPLTRRPLSRGLPSHSRRRSSPSPKCLGWTPAPSFGWFTGEPRRCQLAADAPR